MIKNNINLQEVFLNHVRKERMPITIYLVNGYQLKGIVKGFDNYTIVLESDNKQQMVYKHAISTISPSKQINFQSITSTNEQ
ncbi:RNA chaperone Hfq [Irregularibacter muris]|uniref:RNA-binding protein Hfq n=1 Tax=Irregularibacter muris TaxID=1796619 RepID=A0AAE3HEL3_9FIRM|nr:RNA chaperone Hfq [Irregularibacter muris]MCR1898072.1 RNA chaperone Hfq [Irregularibacter muris]